MAGNFLVRSRHGTVYHFRRRVPLPLQAIIGRAVLVDSLHTSDRRSAIIRSRAIAAHTDLVFQEIKVEAEPHEVEVLNSAIAASLATLGQNAVPSAAAKRTATLGSGAKLTFADAIAEYFAKAQIKPQSKATHRAKLGNAKTFFGDDIDVREIDQVAFTERAVKHAPSGLDSLRRVRVQNRQ